MRRGMVLAVALLALGFVACEEQTVRTEAEDGAPEAATAPEKSAQVGDSITLRGSDENLQVSVTLAKVVDPAQPKDEFFTPEEGNRFVAIQVRLENVGSAVYDDSPGNGASLIGTEGQQFNEALAETNAGPGFGGGVTIRRGDQRTGFIVFELPRGSHPRTFQMTLDSGFGPETGEWELTA